MLLIGSALHLQHLLFVLGMGGSIGKALNSLLVLKLVALQMSGLKRYLLSISSNLTADSLKIILAGSESSTSSVVSCCNKASKSSSFVLICADAIPSAIEEHASSPSSSEMSMVKENKLSGESCFWK